MPMIRRIVRTRSIINRYLHTSQRLQNEERLDIPEDSQYRSFVRDVFTSQFLGSIGHSVAVVQPRFMFGPNEHDQETIDCMMAEVKALIESLPNWSISDAFTVSVKGTSTKWPQIFGSGNLAMMSSRMHNSPKITAVFVNVDSLKATQYVELLDAFKLPIYDRYTLILEIFRTYAKTKEAKLQVALAELHYLKAKLGRTHNWDMDPSVSGSSTNMLGSSIFTNDHKMMMQAREAELKKRLEVVRIHQKKMRVQVERTNSPVVSVVGYTNAGKTSLIRCLTQDKRLVPEDRLFATLAVSTHPGILPSRMNVVYADTIGFISNIPTNLVAAFVSMLDDVRYSKQLVHIRDINHPDRHAQKQTVLSTLRSLEVPNELLDNMIEVWNKVDLVDNFDRIGETLTDNVVLASCHTGEGLKDIEMAVDKNLLTIDDICRARFLVPNGGDALRFLYSQSNVQEAKPTETGDQLIVTTISKRYVIEQFLKKFGNLLYKAK